MEGSLREEDIADQMLGDLRIQDRAGLGVFPHVAVPGKDNQRADPFLAHFLTGTDGLMDHGHHLFIAFFGGQELFELHIAQMVKHPAKLRLEQYNNGNDSHSQELTEDIIQGVQIQNIGQPCNNQHRNHHPGNPCRAG